MTDQRTEVEKSHQVTVCAQTTTDMLVDMFNAILTVAENEKPKRVKAITEALKQHRCIIRAHIDFDCDGPLSFLFFEIREEMDQPRLLFDCTPVGVTKQ